MVNQPLRSTPGGTSHSTNSFFEQLPYLFNTPSVVFFTLDLDGRFVQVSNSSESVWGYRPQELIGTSYLNIIVAKDRPKTQDFLKHLLFRQSADYFENRFIQNGGTQVAVSWTGIWDINDKLFYCFVKEITRKKTGEIQKALNEKEVRSIFSRITDGFISVDKNWLITYRNNKAQLFTGKPDNEILGKNLWSCYPELLGTIVKEQYHRAMREQVAVHFTYYYEKAGAWLDINAYPSENGLSIFFKNINEQKQAARLQAEYERKLKDQNAFLNNILENMKDGFLVLDEEEKVIYCNSEAERILGKHREELLARKIAEAGLELTNTLFYTALQKAYAENAPATLEAFCPEQNKWLETSIVPLQKGISVSIRDISKQKREEEELRKFSLIAKQTENTVMINTLDGRIAWVNDAFLRLFGHSMEETIGKIPGELLDGPETDKRTTRYIFEQIKNASPFHAEILSYAKNGQKIYTELYGQPLFDEQGNARQYFSIGTDITHLKKTEQELHKLSLIAQETSNMVILTDAQKRITWVNNAFTRITGYTLKEAIGHTPSELLDGPGSDPDVVQYINEHYLKGTPFQAEILRYTKSKETYWSEIYWHPLRNAAGEVEQFFSIQIDITERKKLQEQLKSERQELQKLSLVAKKTADAVMFTDADQRITWVNDAFTELTGYTMEEVMGKIPSQLLQGKDTDQNTASYMREQLARGEGFQAEVISYKKNGEKFWTEVSCQPIYDDRGNIQQFFSIERDITDKKELQKEITTAAINAQEQERMQVGLELHDNVNQVLTTVKLYNELCRDGIGNTTEIMDKSIKLLQDSINEIRALSKRLYVSPLKNIKLKDSVRELVNGIGATGKLSILLDTKSIDNLEVDYEIHVTIYRILQEHLTNILKHAEAEKVQIVFDFMDNKLILKVTDDGKGFNIKQKRTGIGITNMTTRAESLNGSLTIKSAPGMGCTLIVNIPLS